LCPKGYSLQFFHFFKKNFQTHTEWKRTQLFNFLDYLVLIWYRLVHRENNKSGRKSMAKIENQGESRLLSFLKRNHSDSMLLACDYDGTLYRGIFPPLGRGFSAADLGILLCLSRSPIQALRIAAAMTRLMFLLVRLRYRYIRGRISMSRMDSILVHFFVRWVMRAVPARDLDLAAGRISGLTYPAARKCIQLLAPRIHAAAIVSKAFEPVLSAVSRRLSALISGNWTTHGVRVIAHSPLEIDRNASVLSRRDKYDRMQQLLDRFPRVRRVLVVGDTEDDIAMAEGARDRLGGDAAFLIAVNAKDSVIRAAADLNLRNWRRLQRILDRHDLKRPQKSGSGPG